VHGIEHGLELLSAAAGKKSAAGTKSKAKSNLISLVESKNKPRATAKKHTRRAGARSS
jgi:hypothetical protein